MPTYRLLIDEIQNTYTMKYCLQSFYKEGNPAFYDSRGEPGRHQVSEIAQSQNGKYLMIPPKVGSKMVRLIETKMEKTQMKSVITTFEEKHEIGKKIKIQ